MFNHILHYDIKTSSKNRGIVTKLHYSSCVIALFYLGSLVFSLKRFAQKVIDWKEIKRGLISRTAALTSL